ncbi:unnamed protein product [Urochloa decumbens]|uniref:Uncharacterized protein n=1 Tax=Urochloa decumbens TaxID=240449 RepID=A0ABC8ZBG0_9POAL
MPPSTAPPASAAARARTVRIFVDGPGRRVLFAEAGADAAAFLSSLLAAPVRAAAADILREDPASAAAACCFGNLAAASDALLPRGAATTSSSSRTPPGMGIMARRLFRCGHLGCPCSDVPSREPGSACPCASRSCRAAATGGTGTRERDTELHFLEACFYRRPDGSAAGRSRGGGGRSGDTFYRRFRVTDERGVECPLCGGRTTVEVKCAAKAGGGGSEEECSSVYAQPDAGHGGGEDAQDGGLTTTCYAIMDDLSVRPVAAGLSGSALLSALGVAADPDDVREETVPFGYKEGFSLLWAALRSKTALTDVFLPAVTPAARRRRR